MRSSLLVLFLALADPQPVLVLASDSCFVHAVPAAPGAGSLERVLESGHTLLHTVRDSGKMTVLVPPTGTVAISTRRISCQTTRIAGVAADAERLYVLVWMGHAYDKPPEEGVYALRTFWLEDGAALWAPLLKTAPTKAPAETLEKGPLRLVEGGVEVYEARATYKGRQLAE